MRNREEINNEIYDQLGERWYTAQDDPIALLRAESALRNPWIHDVIVSKLGPAPQKVLDIGCGAGFLSNKLSQNGHSVSAIDLSEPSLQLAKQRDLSRKVQYSRADACSLPFEDGHFDAVCAMDFLEHVPNPERVVAEAARVLRSGGLFFFYTFNRNPLSWLIAIKGVEWFVRNTPPGLHRYDHFIKPSELANDCTRVGLRVELIRGARPVISGAFWRLLRTGVVPTDFRFKWVKSTAVAYAGVAIRASLSL